MAVQGAFVVEIWNSGTGEVLWKPEFFTMQLYKMLASYSATIGSAARPHECKQRDP
jgi:hypothetical protein